MPISWLIYDSSSSRLDSDDNEDVGFNCLFWAGTGCLCCAVRAVHIEREVIIELFAPKWKFFRAPTNSSIFPSESPLVGAVNSEHH